VAIYSRTTCTSWRASRAAVYAECVFRQIHNRQCFHDTGCSRVALLHGHDFLDVSDIGIEGFELFEDFCLFLPRY